MSSPLPTQDSEAKQGPRITPEILCSGTGRRLWLLSRATYPKQYWVLASDGEEALPHPRLEGIAGLQPLLLIWNEGNRFIMAKQMPQVDADSVAEQGEARENMQAISD